MITEEQRIARKKWLGSSDMAAVLGLDPYRTAYDVYADKLGLDPGFVGNEATERGQDLEPVLVNWAERQLQQPIMRDVFCAGPEGSRIAANLDGDCEPLKAIIEAKTSINSDPDEWGEPGTDEVPLRTIIQTHVAMLCRGYSIAHVPVMLPTYKKFDRRMYMVKRNEEIIAAILERAAEFWELVKDRIPPEGSIGSIDVLKRMRRQPGALAVLPDDVVADWVDVRARRLELEKVEEMAQAKILTLLGEAEGAASHGTLTYLETTSNRKAQEARTITFRTLRFKADKNSTKAMATSATAC